MDEVWNKIESRTLVYGGTWENAQSTIRATVFGVMVELGRDRIKHYRSDLYHDAIWISETITGPMQFDWIARECGTFVGDVVQFVKDDNWSKSARYRFDIREDENQKWVLDIYEAGLPKVPQLCEECGTKEAKLVDYMQMWLCSDFCTGKAENRLNQDTKLPTDVDYSENEAYQLQVEKEPVPYWGTEAAAPFVGSEEMGKEEQSWADRHAALDITECDVATAIEGCVFHPAPVNGWTKNPTLRNESTIRKEDKMDEILRDLRGKLEEANGTKEQLEEYQSNINDAVDDLDSYVNDLEDLISNLDQLPEISVYVDLDTISFDS